MTNSLVTARVLLALFSGALVSVTALAAGHDRGAQSVIASKALLDLQFMTEGRGMLAPPGLPPYRLDSPAGRKTVRAISGVLNDEFGLIVEGERVIGYHDVEYKKHPVGVVGCAVCHAGRAAGVFVPGLGNKTIDIFTLAQTAMKTKTVYWPDEVNKELAAQSAHFINEIGNPKLATKTRGLIPIALIRKWFYDTAGERIDSEIPGAVKIPSLWGYGEKRKVGSFSDGFGRGVLPGWAVAVELVGGQTPANVHKYLPKIETAEDALAELLPPTYPFAIDRAKAARGASSFERACTGCHGTYERDTAGYPIFKAPLMIPLAVVRTDSARLDGVTPRFRELVRANPLNDILQASEGLERGYFAQRLNGVWSRFPYLHNGSVPSVYALLNPAVRPALFSIRNAGERERFDEKTMGLNADPAKSAADVARAAARGERWVYNTQLFEQSNVGHDFQSLRSMPDTERYDIIEYLKTL